MRLMIDIPDKIYETVQNGTYCGTLYEELKNGTPLAESEDCVSRQAVLDLMQMRMGAKELYRAVYDLPPVNPAEKVGQWKRISMDKYVQHAMAYYRCSECGKDIIGTHNYCPSCGAKMQEVEE